MTEVETRVLGYVAPSDVGGADSSAPQPSHSHSHRHFRSHRRSHQHHHHGVPPTSHPAEEMHQSEERNGASMDHHTKRGQSHQHRSHHHHRHRRDDTSEPYPSQPSATSGEEGRNESSDTAGQRTEAHVGTPGKDPAELKIREHPPRPRRSSLSDTMRSSQASTHSSRLPARRPGRLSVVIGLGEGHRGWPTDSSSSAMSPLNILQETVRGSDIPAKVSGLSSHDAKQGNGRRSMGDTTTTAAAAAVQEVVLSPPASSTHRGPDTSAVAGPGDSVPSATAPVATPEPAHRHRLTLTKQNKTSGARSDTPASPSEGEGTPTRTSSVQMWHRNVKHNSAHWSTSPPARSSNSSLHEPAQRDAGVVSPPPSSQRSEKSAPVAAGGRRIQSGAKKESMGRRTLEEHEATEAPEQAGDTRQRSKTPSVDGATPKRHSGTPSNGSHAPPEQHAFAASSSTVDPAPETFGYSGAQRSLRRTTSAETTTTITTSVVKASATSSPVVSPSTPKRSITAPTAVAAAPSPASTTLSSRPTGSLASVPVRVASESHVSVQRSEQVITRTSVSHRAASFENIRDADNERTSKSSATCSVASPGVVAPISASRAQSNPRSSHALVPPPRRSVSSIRSKDTNGVLPHRSNSADSRRLSVRSYGTTASVPFHLRTEERSQVRQTASPGSAVPPSPLAEVTSLQRERLITLPHQSATAPGTSRLDINFKEDAKELYRQTHTVDPLLCTRPGRRQFYIPEQVDLFGMYPEPPMTVDDDGNEVVEHRAPIPIRGNSFVPLSKRKSSHPPRGRRSSTLFMESTSSRSALGAAEEEQRESVDHESTPPPTAPTIITRPSMASTGTGLDPHTKDLGRPIGRGLSSFVCGYGEEAMVHGRSGLTTPRGHIVSDITAPYRRNMSADTGRTGNSRRASLTANCIVAPDVGESSPPTEAQSPSIHKTSMVMELSQASTSFTSVRRSSVSGSEQEAPASGIHVEEDTQLTSIKTMVTMTSESVSCQPKELQQRGGAGEGTKSARRSLPGGLVEAAKRSSVAAAGDKLHDESHAQSVRLAPSCSIPEMPKVTFPVPAAAILDEVDEEGDATIATLDHTATLRQNANCSPTGSASGSGDDGGGGGGGEAEKEGPPKQEKARVGVAPLNKIAHRVSSTASESTRTSLASLHRDSGEPRRSLGQASAVPARAHVDAAVSASAHSSTPSSPFLRWKAKKEAEQLRASTGAPWTATSSAASTPAAPLSLLTSSQHHPILTASLPGPPPSHHVGDGAGTSATSQPATTPARQDRSKERAGRYRDSRNTLNGEATTVADKIKKAWSTVSPQSSKNDEALASPALTTLSLKSSESHTVELRVSAPPSSGHGPAARGDGVAATRERSPQRPSRVMDSGTQTEPVLVIDEIQGLKLEQQQQLALGLQLMQLQLQQPSALLRLTESGRVSPLIPTPVTTPLSTSGGLKSRLHTAEASATPSRADQRPAGISSGVSPSRLRHSHFVNNSSAVQKALHWNS